LPSSRANDGPESTATGEAGRVAASTSGISARLPRSRPLEQLTTGVPGASSGASRALTSRMRCAGGASQEGRAGRRLARSFVARMPAGSATPANVVALARVDVLDHFRLARPEHDLVPGPADRAGHGGAESAAADHTDCRHMDSILV
jgi:hypothetical protein